jgi:hypothetical protein
MAVYTVHEPPLKAGASAAPERFIFVRDGFAFWALLLGPLWMLRHRMWLVLLGYVVVAAALSFVLRLHGTAVVGAIVWALLALLVGFEAGTLRRFSLARRRYRNIGIVVGDDLESAERRFFDSWVKDSWVKETKPAAGAPNSAPALAASLRAPHPASDVLGLFPEPGAVP